MKKKNNQHPQDMCIYPRHDRMNTPHRDTTLGKYLIKRNYELLEMFKHTGRKPWLYGKAEAPIICLDHLIKLNAYVKNDYLFWSKGDKTSNAHISRSLIDLKNPIEPTWLDIYITTYKCEPWPEVQKRIFGKYYHALEKYNNNNG